MSFYDPEVIDPSIIECEKKSRILQPIWEFLITGHEDVLRSPLFPPMLAVIFYFSLTGIFTIIDLFAPWILRGYKIQKQHVPNYREVKNAMVLLFWNHVMWIFPMAFVQLIWEPPTPLPPVAPRLWPFIWQQIVVFFLFDAYYWAWHSLHHKVRMLYRWCHHVHHQYHSPFALMTQYLHPWELFCVGLGITIIPWMFKMHIMTYWCWFCVSSYVSIEVHCGYDFPWALHNWCPIYGGAPKHDLHHARPMSNFEPWLNYLDKLCGWEISQTDLEKAKAKKNFELFGFHNPEDEIGLKVVN